MGRRPTARHWIEAIRSARAQDPRITATTIARRLKAHEGENDPAPVEKTVRKYVDEFDSLEPATKENYRLVYWPESFRDDGPLPWEASPVVAELLRAALEREDRVRLPGGRHPRVPVRVALWFWRASQVAPHLPLENRLRLTARLVLADLGVLGDASGLLRDAERYALGLSEALADYTTQIDRADLQLVYDTLEACGIDASVMLPTMAAADES